MMCERCGERKAEVFYEENRNGVVKKIRLCSHCAKEQGIGGFFGEDDLFGSFSLFPSFSEKRPTENTCPVCGKTLTQIRQSGTFGCSACYDTFGDKLDLTPFLGRNFHGHPLTKKSEEKKEETDEVSVWKEKRSEAVRAERYEEAARLRDKIREREAK